MNTGVFSRRLGVHIVGGVIERAVDQHLYNTVIAFGPQGQEVARYHKMHLSRVRVGPDATSEGSVLEAGHDLAAFDIGEVWRVGLACCFDLRFPQVAAALTDTRGLACNVLLYPSAWLASTGDLGHWDSLLKARALDGQCYAVGANQTRSRDAKEGE